MTAWPSNDLPDPWDPAPNAVAIAAAWDVTIALRNDRTVFGAGLCSAGVANGGLMLPIAPREPCAAYQSPQPSILSPQPLNYWTRSDGSDLVALQRVVALATGAKHGLAIQADT